MGISFAGLPGWYRVLAPADKKTLGRFDCDDAEVLGPVGGETGQQRARGIKRGKPHEVKPEGTDKNCAGAEPALKPALPKQTPASSPGQAAFPAPQIRMQRGEKERCRAHADPEPRFASFID